jgi:proteasome regulatory subunit
MDGFGHRGNIRIMAATNRIDMLDPALLRPGRFDRIIQVPLPDAGARLEILKIHTAKMTLSGNVDLPGLAELAGDTTGAELQAICREAGMMAIRRDADAVGQEDFLAAVRKVKREVAAPDSRMYL